MYDVEKHTKEILIQTARTYTLMARETGEKSYLELARKTLIQLKNWVKTWEEDSTQEFNFAA